MKKVALFLDRDGTLNVNTHYTHLSEDLYLCEGVGRFFAALQTDVMAKIIQPIVVTNQSGVGRGYYSKDQCLLFERALREKISYPLTYKYFYHAWSQYEHPDRKPNPGMLIKAMRDHNLVAGYMIGDKDSDVEAGLKAGCRLSFKLTKNRSLADCLPEIVSDLKQWNHTREHF